MYATFTHEYKLWQQGHQFVAGIDEVGRGAWAGPVVAAAVIFPPNLSLSPLLMDSKQLTAPKRQKLVPVIKELSISYAIGEVSQTEVDQYGIVWATEKAMRLSLRGLSFQPDFHLIDAFSIKFIPQSVQQPIIKGDTVSTSIAAASILAKEYRDNLMRAYDESEHFRKYSFGTHKGYGTKKHREAIEAYGVCELHRRSFVKI